MNPNIKIFEDCQVVMLTFGGKQIFTMKQGDFFFYGKILIQNESYTIFENGLNYYVFPTKSIELKLEPVTT